MNPNAATWGAYRRDGPETSRAAAHDIAGYAPIQRGFILGYLCERGEVGATDDEGELALGIIAQSYTPRRGELVRAGLVVDSGERRPTRRGRGAIVWRAAIRDTVTK
jgi:hypothetical protein